MVSNLRSGWNEASDSTSHFLSDNGPGGNCFWLLDVMILLAGIRTQSSSSWIVARPIQHVSNGLFSFEVIVLVVQLWTGLDDSWDDMAVNVLGLLKAASACLCCTKVLMLIYAREPIENLRIFILDNRVSSGDKAFDELEQRKLSQTARTMLRAMFGLIAAEMILLSIPNQTMASVFRMPSWTGTFISRLLYFVFVTTLPLGILPRLMSHVSYVGILIMGMRMKLAMLANRYRLMTSMPVSDLDQYFESVHQALGETLSYHLNYLRMFHILASLIGKTFLIIHFYSIFSIGTILFMGKYMGLNVFSCAFVLTSFALLLEYYVWCYLVDSLQRTAASIGDLVYEICAFMPYSRAHHSRYVQLKTSLFIVWIYNKNGYTVNCFGLLHLSMLAFVNLLDIAYTVLMFLINMT